jgi:hypothetical protein
MRHPLQHDDDIEDDSSSEKIFKLDQENIRLRGQITYLQEELSSIEGELDKVRDGYERRIEQLERELGDALYLRE